MIWLDMLKRFWPFILGALVIVSLWNWHLSKVDEADRAGYARAMLAADAERAVEKLKADRRREETDRAYQTKVSELETRVDRLLARHDAPIRLCSGPIEVRVPEAASVADGPGEARPAEEIGGDLRPRLVSYGKGCEGIREKLSELQGWINALQ
jgi:hypothetical protein